MFVMFWGRLLQLTLKTAQYKIVGKGELAKSFSSDLSGFLEGWSTYRKMPRRPLTEFRPATVRSGDPKTSTGR
jgi:hypothetical protein